MLALQQAHAAVAMSCSTAAIEMRPARRCSSCGQQGHNARTCLEKDDRARPSELAQGGACISEDLDQSSPREVPQISPAVAHYEPTPAASLSGSDTQQGTTPSPHFTRERRRGTPWTEEEHRAFLAGLEKLGKGDWRGISKDFVTSRTPTQVASHAQKYFIRHSNQSKRKRRTSLFDLKADAEAADTMRSRGSAEATSTTWPDVATQHTSAVPLQQLQNNMWQPSPLLHQRASAMHLQQASSPSQRDRPALSGQMWYPQSGLDLTMVQHYMQMTGLPLETAMLQVMSYQAAAAQNVAMPSLPTFLPPSLAEQLMAAYSAQAAAQFPSAGFPPSAFPPSAANEVQAPMHVPGMLPQQAAAAFALFNNQQAQQAQQQGPQHALGQHAMLQPQQAAHQSGAIPSPMQIQRHDAAQQAQQAEGSSKSSPQPACHTPSKRSQYASQQASKTGSPLDLRQLNSGGNNLAGSDPAFGHGRLYRPQASHAKAVMTPAVMRFGNFEDPLSRRSSSESAVPPSAIQCKSNQSPACVNEGVLVTPQLA